MSEPLLTEREWQTNEGIADAVNALAERVAALEGKVERLRDCADMERGNVHVVAQAADGAIEGCSDFWSDCDLNRHPGTREGWTCPSIDVRDMQPRSLCSGCAALGEEGRE